MRAPSPAPPAGGGREPAAVRALDAVGDGAVLLARALREATTLRPRFRQPLREAALVTVGSVLALVAVSLLGGLGCGLEAVAVSRQLGARGAVGGLSVICSVREVVPLAFGYVLALGVGCGLVADLARGGDDDPARRGAPRVAGVLVAFPFAYLLTLACTTMGLFLMGIGRFGDVSLGTFIGLFLAFQDDTDLAFSVGKSFAMAIFVLGAALVLGARAAAGREGAGRAVARFAVVAVVGVTLLGALATVVLWGANTRIPAG